MDSMTMDKAIETILIIWRPVDREDPESWLGDRQTAYDFCDIIKSMYLKSEWKEIDFFVIPIDNFISKQDFLNFTLETLEEFEEYGEEEFSKIHPEALIMRGEDLILYD